MLDAAFHYATSQQVISVVDTHLTKVQHLTGRRAAGNRFRFEGGLLHPTGVKGACTPAVILYIGKVQPSSNRLRVDRRGSL